MSKGGKIGGWAKDGKAYCNYHVVGKLHTAIYYKPQRHMPECSVCLRKISCEPSLDLDYVSHSNLIGSRLNKSGPILP